MQRVQLFDRTYEADSTAGRQAERSHCGNSNSEREVDMDNGDYGRSKEHDAGTWENGCGSERRCRTHTTKSHTFLG